MDEYFETFGGVRDYLGGVVDEARRTGFTETILGRRRYLPDLTSDNRQRREMAERMALNAPIQGSAADIIKVAMLNVDRALARAGLASRMLLQVHDELVFEVAPGEREALEALVRERDGRAPPTCRCRSTSRSAPAAAGTTPRTEPRRARAATARVVGPCRRADGTARTRHGPTVRRCATEHDDEAASTRGPRSASRDRAGR